MLDRMDLPEACITRDVMKMIDEGKSLKKCNLKEMEAQIVSVRKKRSSPVRHEALQSLHHLLGHVRFINEVLDAGAVHPILRLRL